MSAHKLPRNVLHGLTDNSTQQAGARVKMSVPGAAVPRPAHAVPPPPAFDVRKGRHSTTIRIAKWTITATKRPILNGKEIEAVEKRLSLPLPEMTFGNNSLSLVYDPNEPGPSSRPFVSESNSLGSTNSANVTPSTTGRSSAATEVRFDALEALEGVATGEGWEERVGGGVKVSMAEKWERRSTSPNHLGDSLIAPKPVKPHDWTYSTCYAGSSTPGFSPSDQHEIPVKLLARQDPVLDQILFYEDVPLFEDELHDHGESILNVRIRVMPHSFFILARLFLRVDDVLFRLFDVRVFHAFGSGEVIREVTGLEADYGSVRSRLKSPADLSPLTDPDFVFNAMTSLACAQGRPLPSEGDGRPWPGLGKRVEVLELPGAQAGPNELDEMNSRVGSMAIRV